MTDIASYAVGILGIVWINVVLSADNAIMIALASRGLPERQRRLCMMLGAAGAVALRVVFTLVVAHLLAVPFLKLGGGLFVVYLAAKLPSQGGEAQQAVAGQTLAAAVWSIIATDAVMSLDNALALAAAANGSTLLIVLGLLISAPLVVFGARMVSSLMDRLPFLIWAGAAMLGWAGGELIAGDPAWGQFASVAPDGPWTGALAVALVLAVAARRRFWTAERTLADEGGR